jgi:hypothetical protein
MLKSGMKEPSRVNFSSEKVFANMIPTVKWDFFSLEFSAAQTPSLDYSRMQAIERRALQSEAMILYLGAVCKLSLCSERLRERQTPSRNTALNLFASVPRSSRPASRSTQCHRFSSKRE